MERIAVVRVPCISLTLAKSTTSLKVVVLGHVNGNKGPTKTKLFLLSDEQNTNDNHHVQDRSSCSFFLAPPPFPGPAQA